MRFFGVENLGIAFGGVRAVDGVSFELRRGEVYTIIGPNGAGKTTIFNLIGLIYPATTGRILFQGRELTGMTPHRVAELGIARTFQNIELFEHATVLQNLLIGRHRHRRTALWQELAFTPAVRSAERAQREAVERVIDFLELAHYRDSMVAGLPYGVRMVIEIPHEPGARMALSIRRCSASRIARWKPTAASPQASPTTRVRAKTR